MWQGKARKGKGECGKERQGKVRGKLGGGREGGKRERERERERSHLWSG